MLWRITSIDSYNSNQKRGISVETLKYLMGHTDISVTSNVYTHLKLEDEQREMERLERIEKEMKKCAK